MGGCGKIRTSRLERAWLRRRITATTTVIRIEKHRDENDVTEAMGHLAEWLSGSEQASLRRAIIVWFYRVFLPNRAPELEFPEVSDFTNLHEVHDMLAERIKKWPELWQERGRKEGIQEGRQEAEQRALESKRNAARKLIALTEMSDQLIADIEELPIKEVETLRAETQH